MRKLWLLIGRIGFWCSWPATWVYLHGTHRSRILITNETGKILVVKGWLSLQKWSLPGGGMHRGEDPKLAAIRETDEETSVALEPDQLQFLVRQKLRSKGFVVDTYLYTAKVSKSLVTKSQHFEIIEVAWLDPKEINQQTAEPDVILALQTWSR